VDVATGVQVALVDDDAAAGEAVLDLERLDAEVAGEAAADEGPHVLGREGRAVRRRRALAHGARANS
jgi:hypothetical protein